MAESTLVLAAAVSSAIDVSSLAAKDEVTALVPVDSSSYLALNSCSCEEDEA